MDRPLVSVLIVVRNGSRHIIAALDSVRAQDYSPLETLVIDGLSEDRTQSLVEEYARQNPAFSLRVLHNPGRIQASGWNVGIRAANGAYILRLDAVHCQLQPDYVRLCLEALQRLQAADATVAAAGGRRLSVATAPSGWGEASAAAQRSRFGVGNATYRLGTTSGFTDTLGVPLYDRQVLFKVGLFNESLGRSEDNELHARLRERGYKLYFLADAVALYHPRTTLAALGSQMFHNGWWVSATAVRLHGFPFGIRHVIPFAFWMVLLATGALALISFPARIVFFALLATYLVGSIAAAIHASRSPGFWRVTFVFWMMHACYAAGTMLGFFASKDPALTTQAASRAPSLEPE